MPFGTVKLNAKIVNMQTEPCNFGSRILFLSLVVSKKKKKKKKKKKQYLAWWHSIKCGLASWSGALESWRGSLKSE